MRRSEGIKTDLRTSPHRKRGTPSDRIHYKVVGNRSVDCFVRRYLARVFNCIVSLQAGIFKSRYVRYTPFTPYRSQPVVSNLNFLFVQFDFLFSSFHNNMFLVIFEGDHPKLQLEKVVSCRNLVNSRTFLTRFERIWSSRRGESIYDLGLELSNRIDGLNHTWKLTGALRKSLHVFFCQNKMSEFFECQSIHRR